MAKEGPLFQFISATIAAGSFGENNQNVLKLALPDIFYSGFVRNTGVANPLNVLIQRWEPVGENYSKALIVPAVKSLTFQALPLLNLQIQQTVSGSDTSVLVSMVGIIAESEEDKSKILASASLQIIA